MRVQNTGNGFVPIKANAEGQHNSDCTVNRNRTHRFNSLIQAYARVHSVEGSRSGVISDNVPTSGGRIRGEEKARRGGIALEVRRRAMDSNR